ncbi:glycoside hydrolase family protein [Rhodobacter phage RcCronus]|uniref:Distal tail protein n=2 Tax=Cronusvirus cronus TaxID=2005060 RepID=A0A0K1Y6G4_9CAUD|nr:glycoside hydrolase [Rhodobacter phage RcCronus]AKU43303.1 glycoside hydrolase family protein [Rhodobacter phage RcCronus]AKY02681.1 distal tail protein [Rhodobacter phage RcSaxon]
MAFLDVAFPRDVAAGVVGGPERRVDIVALSSGDEERNARWKHSRRSYDAGFGIKSVDDLAEVVALFEQAGGQLHSFRFRDWSDFSSAPTSTAKPGAADVRIGTGNGTISEFQLVKRYGGLAPYVRPITKPVPGTVKVSLDGTPAATGWSVDNLTGLVTFTAPPGPGVVVRAGFLFDVPVRFDTPRLAVEMSYFAEDDGDGRGFGHVPAVPLVEVRE